MPSSLLYQPYRRDRPFQEPPMSFGGVAGLHPARDAQGPIDRLEAFALDIPSGLREYQYNRVGQLLAQGQAPPMISPYAQHGWGFSDQGLREAGYAQHPLNYNWYYQDPTPTPGGGYGDYGYGGGGGGGVRRGVGSQRRSMGLVSWRI
jgi:hypothetical protein